MQTNCSKNVAGRTPKYKRTALTFLLSAPSPEILQFIFRAKQIVGLPPRLTSFRIISSESVCSANKKIFLVYFRSYLVNFCISQPFMVHRLNSYIFLCLFVRLSRYGKITPSSSFFFSLVTPVIVP